MAAFNLCLGVLAIMSQNVLRAAAAPASGSISTRASTAVPPFVLSYAPVVYLHSQDPYFPSDLGAQLVHTKPEVNLAVVQGVPSPLTLDNLASLNSLGGTNVYLTSVDDITKNPAWLKGVKPDGTGKTNGAVSTVIIVNDHGGGNVDAFYLYFYAYNQGPPVFGQEIGDHVGDWEHNMIRFKNGVPQAIWYSQHAYGEAFTYDAVDKQGIRPIVYSAKGSHAVYATPGAHDHSIPGFNLPFGPVEDQCDKGPFWDPTLSAYVYRFDANANTYTAYDGVSPTNWLSFTGKWGDQQYPDSDRRQKKIFSISATAKFVGGPTGPYDKQLNRPDVCTPNKDIKCFVSPFLRP